MRIVLPIILAICVAAPLRAQNNHPTSTPASESFPGLKDRRTKSGILTPQQIIDHLGLIKGNNTPEARRLGAARILEIGSSEAIAKLREILTQQPADLAAQVAVCEAVSAAQSPSPELIGGLLELLGDQRPVLADAVIRALSRFESEAVLARLGPLASDGSLDIEHRLAAIKALGIMSDTLTAVGILMDLLRDASPTVRAFALIACREAAGIDFEDAEAAEAWWKDAQSMADTDWLRHRIEQKAGELRRIATEQSALTARLVAATRESYHRSPESERARQLPFLLGDTSPAMRRLGLDLINDLITDRKDVSPEIKAKLVDALSDPVASVRSQAAKLVGDLRLPGAFSKLSRAFTQELDPVVRVAQIGAIGRFDELGVLPALLSGLEDEIPTVVAESALGLARLFRRPGSTNGTGREDTTGVPEAIAERFKKVRPEQEALREQLIVAMTILADARFRPVMRAELEGPRPINVRRAAIAGLASFGDVEAADAVRPRLSDSEAVIRLAAAEGLAKCGKRRGDLGALAEHLDAPAEADPLVRQRAWESYLAIAAQLPPEDRLRLSDEFDRPMDKAAQRRRLEILKPLAIDTVPQGGSALPQGAARFEPLSKAKRIEVLERMADAQANLGEVANAAASLDQVLTLLEDKSGPRFVELAVRAVAARLKAHEDGPALQRLQELVHEHADDAVLASALAAGVLKEIRVRGESATEAAVFVDALGLLDLARPVLARLSESTDKVCATLRAEILEKRIQFVDKLLGDLGVDAEAESKLLAYPREAVVTRLVERMKTRGANGSTGPENQDQLIGLAKRLAPSWTGIPPNATPEQRAAALGRLLDQAPAVKASTEPRGNVTGSQVRVEGRTAEP